MTKLARTDTITGGSVINKTVLVHRDYVTDHVDSPRVAELLELARELEGLCDRGTPLDIEFAKTRDGQLHLLQVRRITVQENWNRRISRHVSEVLFSGGRIFHAPLPTSQRLGRCAHHSRADAGLEPR